MSVEEATFSRKNSHSLQRDAAQVECESTHFQTSITSVATHWARSHTSATEFRPNAPCGRMLATRCRPSITKWQPLATKGAATRYSGPTVRYRAAAIHYQLATVHYQVAAVHYRGAAVRYTPQLVRDT